MKSNIRWTLREDSLLKSYMENHSTWDDISQLELDRTKSACQSRAYTLLLKLNTKSLIRQILEEELSKDPINIAQAIKIVSIKTGKRPSVIQTYYNKFYNNKVICFTTSALKECNKKTSFIDKIYKLIRKFFIHCKK